MGKPVQNPPQFVIARTATNACAHQIAWAFCVSGRMKFTITAEEWYPVLGLGFKFNQDHDPQEITFDDFTDFVIAANLFQDAQERLAIIDQRIAE